DGAFSRLFRHTSTQSRLRGGLSSVCVLRQAVHLASSGERATMPLQLPNLDDRRYADLVEEARRLIPTYAPRWTNHNPSDPGVTLLELFAYLSELLIYRLNRVTSANVISFLKLLNGPNWRPLGKKPEELTEEEIARALPHEVMT